MSVRIAIACDTPDCGSYCQITASDVAAARAHAADRWDWSSEDGRDYCRACTPGHPALRPAPSASVAPSTPPGSTQRPV